MKLRLLPKLLLLILCPVLIMLSGLSVFSYIKAEQALRHQLDVDMQLVVSQQVREYQKFHSNMSSVAQAFSLRRIVHKVFADGDVSDAEGAAREVMASWPDVRHVELLNPEGKRLFVQGQPSFVDFKASGLLGQLNAGKDVFATLQKEKTQELLVVIAVPVFASSTDKKVLGAVALSMPMDAIGAKHSDLIRVGTTGKCFVLDSKGLILLDPTDKGSIGLNISDIDWIRTMLNNPKGIIRYAWNNIPKSCFYERVAGPGWVVGLGFTDDDLLAPMTLIRNNTLWFSLGALIVLAVIVVLVVRSFTGMLKGAVTDLTELSTGKMDLAPEFDDLRAASGARSDEFGELARCIKEMQIRLKEMFGRAADSAKKAEAAAEEARVATQQAEEALQKAESSRRETITDVTSRLEGITNNLSASAQTLASQIAESERGSEEQAVRVAETATAMEEMNATVLEVARNAGQASDASTQTRGKATEGSSVVQRAVNSIQQVQRESLALKEDMATLGQNAQAISQIMGVISDIADQTNLLALNAAIEAARAGDAGRGFAVVADEVRKLAEKTMASTTDVGNAIRAIQQSADKSMAQVDEAVKTIEEATTLADQSGQALGDIVNMVDATADQVRAIATAAEEQSASSEEINISVEKVNVIAQETAQAMRSAAHEVSELAHQAKELKALMDDIKKD